MDRTDIRMYLQGPTERQTERQTNRVNEVDQIDMQNNG